VSVLPAQYINQNRLLQNARNLDASVIDESTKVAAFYVSLYITTTMLFVIFFFVLNPANRFSIPLMIVLFLGEVSLSGYLGFNLQMLLMDLKVSSLLLDQLFILADNRALSMEKFNLVRADIHRRVSISKWASDFIAAPCILSAVVLIIIFTSGQLRALNVALLLVKEILFVGVAFWYVATVNEKADMLTRKLCATMWRKDEVLDSTMVVSDTERLSICSTCFAEPISFMLLFKRLSLHNVAVSFAGFAVSMVVGVVKQALGV
jgi:hypothetical protein